MPYRRANGDAEFRGEIPGGVRGMMDVGNLGVSLEKREQTFRKHLGQMAPEEWRRAFPEQVERAKRLAEELGLAGVVERMKGLDVKIEAAEGTWREFMEGMEEDLRKGMGEEGEVRMAREIISGKGWEERKMRELEELRGTGMSVEELRAEYERKLVEELAREGKSWGPS